MTDMFLPHYDTTGEHKCRRRWEEEVQILVPCVGEDAPSNFSFLWAVYFNNVITAGASCMCVSYKSVLFHLVLSNAPSYYFSCSVLHNTCHRQIEVHFACTLME